MTTIINRDFMKEAILRHIELNPGCRRRELPNWGANRVAEMSVLSELEAEGKIYSARHDDRANMESYYKYYANN